MFVLQGPYPTSFGKYQVLRHVRIGGTADVFEALDTNAGDRRVALKVALPEVVADEDARKRFLAEGKAAARLPRHENLCLVYECGEHQGTPYLAMEYLDGGTLVPSASRDPWDAVALVHTLALALQAAHDAGVTHRDLKPGNILFTAGGTPRISDFGLALRRFDPNAAMPKAAERAGTPGYMAPEQLNWHEADVIALAKGGASCDIFSLGVILFELLTGTLPLAPREDYYDRLRSPSPLPPPSVFRPGLPPVLDRVCGKALAKNLRQRYASLRELADDLARALGSMHAGGPGTPAPTRPLVLAQRIHQHFVPFGTTAPESDRPRDQLFLDVGNRLQGGVIDHHHLVQATGSTASLVLTRPGLIDEAVNPERRPDAPFVLVLHERPDLDCVVSAYLATAYLAGRRFPDGAEALARYVDHSDQGRRTWSFDNPFALHTAFTLLIDRLSQQTFNTEVERWQAYVRAAFRMIDGVLRHVADGEPLDAVDAVACSDVLGEEDRKALAVDRDRYRHKLANPRSNARTGLLLLPGQFGGRRQVTALLVRDVQNAWDPEGCTFFKNWARTDEDTFPATRGVVALSVFMSEGPGQARRCVLSVRPEDGVTLRGLGELLDEAEAEARRRLFGVDDRVEDPLTHERKPARPGYANSDPWYDGRAHASTIVDSPRGGTILTADQIETLFLDYGKAIEVHPLPPTDHQGS